MFLAQLEVRKLNLKDALDLLATSKNFFDVNSTNYIQNQEIQTRVLILKGDFNNALKTVSNLSEINIDLISKLSKDVFKYYKANALFKLCRFKESKKELIFLTNFSEDKTGWEIGYRMLMIQNHIELEHYDQASAAIEALRKHMTNKKHDQLMRQRDVLILKIMRSLSNASFTFKQTRLLEAESLKKLESKDSRYAFEFFCHEMFPFQEWFAEKTKS